MDKNKIRERNILGLSIFGAIANKIIFACSVGEAESGLERLHQCAEKELQQFLAADGPSKEFDEFRTKLAGLTRYCCTLSLTCTLCL